MNKALGIGLVTGMLLLNFAEAKPLPIVKPYVVKGYYDPWHMRMYIIERHHVAIWVDIFPLDGEMIANTYPLSEVRISVNRDLRGASHSERKAMYRLRKLHAIERYMISVYDKGGN
jgi:hypothetical protein